MSDLYEDRLAAERKLVQACRSSPLSEIPTFGKGPGGSIPPWVPIPPITSYSTFERTYLGMFCLAREFGGGS